MFYAISQNLQGCERDVEGGENFFKCNTCENFGQCYKTLSESVATIAEQMADLIKINLGFKLDDEVKNRIEKNFIEEHNKKTNKPPPSDLYC